MAGVEVRIREEAGRHFMGPVPAERECSGRSFRIMSTRDRILARVTELHPDICVIFMSGYSEDALLENRLLSQQNITLVQKPFDPEDLAQKNR